ncbi:sperm acrosome-associated protein 9 [Pelodytes ibericus]
MEEVKEGLKELEKQCQLLHQQQVTFITALERTRQNAQDRIKPVRSLEQVRNYLENYCNNTTDSRILSLFLSVCEELAEFSIKLHEHQSDRMVATDILEENVDLLNPSNDLSGLRAKYPHDAVNHLSCDEAKNFYGGVVSVIPLALDNIREAIARMEKPQSRSTHLGRCDWKDRQHSGTKINDPNATHNMGVQTMVNLRGKKFKGSIEPCRPAWKPAGRFSTC